MSQGDLFSLKGKTALITGGATGIGRMATKGLMGAGADVLVVSRKGEACTAAAAELNALGLPGEAVGFSGDVSAEAALKDLTEDVKSRMDRLDILINNAGTSWGEPLERFPHAAWDRIMSVNVAGLFTLTQMLLPLLRASAKADDPARVVNVGSVMGEVPMGDGAYSYSASKAAVHHITRILAKELAAEKVTVNALAPGPFVSNMTAFATKDEAMRARVGAEVPLGRVGIDDDIAGTMVYLCSRAGAYVTGAILPVSGGINVGTGPAIFDAALEG